MKIIGSRSSTKLFSDPAALARAVEAQRKQRSAAQEYVAPRRHAEQVLAEIWAALLRIDRVGVFDNFFKSGGHSLLAAQMLARLRKQIGVELPLHLVFEKPVLADLAIEIERTRQDQTYLFSRRPRPDHIPLSYAQEQLWFLHHLESGSPVYNVAQLLQVSGAIDRDTLAWSINQVVARHEILRTLFRWREDAPVQVILPELAVELQWTEVACIGDETPEAAAEQMASEARLFPFDLENGPLLRVAVFQLSPARSWLMLEMHHIISDRWSFAILLKETFAFYSARRQGRTAELPALEVQYADVTLWQRERFADAGFQAQLEYWKDRLRNAPQLLELPLDHLRPATQAHHGAIANRLLPQPLVGRLLALSEEAGATLFMVLLAGLQLLLARLSGQEDIVVGSPIANRTHSELEPLIGLFVNAIALRTTLSDDPSFSELLTRVKRTCLDAFENASVPFERVVEMLQPERSLSYNPLFQVMFAYQGAPAGIPACDDLSLEVTALKGTFSTFDLLWTATASAAGIALRVEYDTDLFDQATIERWLGNYEQLLWSAMDSSETGVAALDLMDEVESNTILREFNAIPAQRSAVRCIHHLFEAQVERAPEATALVWRDERTSYRELNERSNQLAHHLIAVGVKPETTVGVFLPRTPEMLIAIIAVLKAGGAYVPLDPNYPKERLGNILEDSKARLVLTQEGLGSDLPQSAAQVLSLDTLRDVLAAEDSGNPGVTISPEQLAYVLFTSGSTGRPKGVAIEHHSAGTFLQWVAETFPRELMAGMLFSTSICFDLSVFEIFGTLTRGGQIIVAENALLLPHLQARHEVTFINTVPSAIAELIRAGAVPSSVKIIALAGEALAQGLVDEIYERTNVELVYNLYGPTEDTTYSTCKELPRGATVTIGRPISHTQAYVLDARRQPVPLGVAGELYLAGAGLARGYFGQPAMTAERFVPNPFSPEADARMYKTGDLCRWLPSGELEYRGRIDSQIKLRGFRIELGEIESVLARHPGVQQCLAMVWEKAPEHRQLVAYVVAAPGAAPDPDDLRAYLKQSLPEFMVPTGFVRLDQFALTPNGKIDRRALPAPDHAGGSKQNFVAPRNELEQQLAAIWGEVLRSRSPGVYDDFFTLGGHSLLATQVISRIRHELSLELPLREIFEAPTIAELAGRIERLQQTPAAALIRPTHRKGNLPLSFAQQRLWFLDQLEPDSPLYNTPLAIRMTGMLRTDLLERAINEIVRRHEILRTTVALEGDQAVQVVAPELSIELVLIDLSDEADEVEAAAKEAAIRDARQPFDLAAGPLLRARLLRMSSTQHVLLLTTHHIVNDGWSIPKVIRELKVLYEAFLQEKPSPLPELRLQYADYAVWQREWMKRGAGETQLAYWKQLLAGAPDTIALPTDRKPSLQRSYAGATERVLLPKSLAIRLQALSRAENATLYMTLLAAYQVLLFRYSHQEDIVVGSPIAGRNRAEIEDLIGFFVNTLVMRTDLSGDPQFRELLGRVRALCVGAYANQDLPFEQLVESLHPNRDANRMPLFQVWFALQNLPRAVFEISGLELKPLEVHNGTSKFDLGMFVAETPDGLACTVEYATDLFDRSTVQSLLRHYGVLLESIVAHPEQRISALALLREGERTELLVGRNEPLETFCEDACIHELFESQVRRSPASIAVVFGDAQLTYAELNSRANQLAHRLRGMGTGPETLVAICLEPSLEMLVAVLGVLKAGGAYLPVDTSYPQDRQAFMLRDGQVSVVIAGAAFSAPLPAGAVRLNFEDHAGLLSSESAENPRSVGGADSLAYVIYTSGSTGKSKGVMIPHRNVTRLFRATDGWFDFGPGDTWTLFHSIAFDFSVWEIWGALLYGGRLIVVPRLVAQSPDDFHDLLVRHQVTVLNQTPSAFRQLTEADGRSTHAEQLALRVVIFGGEALELHALAPWIARHPVVPALVNMYGITETTVHVTYLQISAAAIAESAGSLIGTRIPDLETYVLDRHMEPVPVGVVGELYVGGGGVARGYLNRPELTAQRFLPHPFSSTPGARVYRTGDLARILRDGGMEYLGRIDDQVKIRGYRVELGEIEKTLEAHPQVTQSVVLAHEDEPGEKRLVAYVVARTASVADERAPVDLQMASEQVAQWALAFDETYANGGTPADATFNITGWDSSYTGAPIAADQMREWVDSTVERISALEPRRVWEIGCGTGLLLFRLAPQCEQYLGSDISQTSLNFLARQLGRPEWSLPQVELRRSAAHEAAPSRADMPLDTVILNSVIQYFPSVDYLIDVLGRAISAVGSAGNVFIGDVRNLSLLELFHTSVELSRAPDALPANKLLQRIKSSVRQEAELLLAPEFFLALSEHFPQIERVEIQLKRGGALNELTLFRYDVVLHVGLSPRGQTQCEWLDWRKGRLNLSAVKEMLERDCPDTIGLCGLPNARLQAEVAALAMLGSSDMPPTAGAVRAASSRIAAAAADSIDPEDLWAIENELPYRIELRPSRAGVDGRCDVLFRRVGGACMRDGCAEPIFPGAAGRGLPLRTYANHPLQRAAGNRLVPELRRWLGEKLPPYMVPSAFVLLDAIPLTANGKVNKKALPVPDGSVQTDRRDFIAPRTPVEQITASIWEDVLHLDQVGVEDDFFELGGHSLSATQVIVRIRQTFQVELTLKTLFQTPQVAKLAEAIERLQRGDGEVAVPPITRADRSGPIPLSFAQQRLWFLAEMEPGNALYNVPRAYHLKGRLDVPAFERALNGLIARHEILRTTYGLQGDEPVQIIAPERRCELRVEDLSRVSDLLEVKEREAARRAQEEADRPFCLTTDGMLRVLLLRLHDEHHLLLLNIHHIATDGWSGGILLRELTALYEAALEDTASPLPELPIQYADYAVWQRAWLGGHVLEMQLAYWKAKLAGAPSVLALPTDKPRSSVVGHRGAVRQVELPATLLDAVRSLSSQEGTTPFMTLLAAFQSVLLYVTGQTDLVVGTDVANRPTAQTEDLIGFFVNLLVLRTDLSGNPTFQALLRRVRTVALGAYAHQDVVFDKLVGELQPERSLTHNPLVQVLFVEQNTPRSQVPLRGMTMTPHGLEVPSKFDMALFVSQVDSRLDCRWLFNSDLFAAGTIARMAALYGAAIEVATSHPDIHLNGLMQCLERVDAKYRATEHAGYEELSLKKLRRAKQKAVQAL